MEHEEADFGDNFFGEEDEAPVDMEMVREGMKLVPLSDMGFGEPEDVMDVDPSIGLMLPHQINFQGSSKEALGYPREAFEAAEAKPDAALSSDAIAGDVVADTGPKPDFSLWTAEDDLLLKNAVEAGAAIEALAKGAFKFSQRYTIRELRERWWALLYDKDISEEASARILKCEVSAASSGKTSNPRRLKDQIESLRRRKLNSVRTHYYKMRKRIAPEQAPLDHISPTHDMEDSKEMDSPMEESAFSHMVRLLAVGGVKAVVQALPFGSDSITEDSSFIGLLSQENSQMQTPQNLDGLKMVPPKGDREAGEPGKDVHVLSEELGVGTVAEISTTCELTPMPIVQLKVVETAPEKDSPAKLPGEVRAASTCCDPRQGDDLPIGTSEHSDSESILNETNERGGVDDDLTSSEKSSMLGAPYFESMICVLNTEDTDIPSPPPRSRSHSPLLFPADFSPLEVKGDENEANMLGGDYERADAVEFAVTLSKASVLESNLGALPGSREPTLDGLEIAQGLKAEIKDKDAVIPLENAGAGCKSFGGILASKGSFGAESSGAPIDSQALLENDLFGDQSVDDLMISKRSAQENPDECLESEEEMPSFSDVESMILNMDLDTAYEEDASARAESRRLYRKFRKTFMRLEQGANAALERSLTLRGAIACLYGHYSRHYITTNKVLLGRMTDDNHVDIDLAKEGRANKVSRKQATIKLKEDGVFYLKNLGKRAITVNNISIASGQHANLGCNCLIEVGGMRFIFEINNRLVKQRVTEMIISRVPSGP